MLLLQALDELLQHLLPRVAQHGLLGLFTVALALLGIQNILFHTYADVVGVARLGLAAHGAVGVGLIEAILGFHEHRVVLVTILLESANFRNHLRHAHAHLLKVTQAPALTIRSADTDIGQIVEHVDILVAETHVLRTQHETIGETLQGHAA